MSGRVSKEDIFILVFPVSFANASTVLSDPALNGTIANTFFDLGPSSFQSGHAGFLADTTLLRARVLGNTLAAIAYGFSILLFITCIKHMRRQKEDWKTDAQSRRRKLAMYGYVTCILVLGTASFLQNTIYATVTSSFVRPEKIDNLMDTLSAYGAPLPSLFIIWAADGLLVSALFNIIVDYSHLIPRLFIVHLWHSFIAQSLCIKELLL